MTRVLIVDDHDVVRSGVRALLENLTSYEVAIETLNETAPAVACGKDQQRCDVRLGAVKGMGSALA